jgi:acyl-homoserine lactone acylase PvdQ
LIADALVDATREAEDEGGAVLFAHTLGITEAARRRFNIGPFTPTRADAPVFAVRPNPSDWDLSTAMNAPGQAGAPDSAHYGDLATRWAAGASIMLPFTEAAVQAAAESTLTLTGGK